LYGDSDRRDQARAMLAEIYGWFTEGFDTADLKDAKGLLRGVGRTDGGRVNMLCAKCNKDNPSDASFCEELAPAQIDGPDVNCFDKSPPTVRSRRRGRSWCHLGNGDPTVCLRANSC
jgi:hypothetical protein